MIVVNFATEQYKRPQQRLAASLFNRGVKAMIFDSYKDIESPTHQESPYEFKIHAIRKAFEVDDVVLWADSSFYLVGDIAIIEKIILQDGFFGSEAGHYAGRWTNQHARNYFKVTEEEMQQNDQGIKLFSAGLLGLHLKNEKAMKFLYEWEQSAKAGCFKGSWEDHRHDQSCASIIATRLGFKFQRGGQHMSYIGPGYAEPEKDSVFYLQGMA